MLCRQVCHSYRSNVMKISSCDVTSGLKQNTNCAVSGVGSCTILHMLLCFPTLTRSPLRDIIGHLTMSYLSLFRFSLLCRCKTLNPCFSKFSSAHGMSIPSTNALDCGQSTHHEQCSCAPFGYSYVMGNVNFILGSQFRALLLVG